MIVRISILFFLLSAGSKARTQNLIYNPSFEIKLGCPDNFSQINKADGWRASGATPDYFHNCGFYWMEYGQPIAPFRGNAITSIGISFPFSLREDTIFREYMEGKLIQTLDNDLYWFSMRVLADPKGRTKNLGILFSDTFLGYIGTYPKSFVPQLQFSEDWLGDYGKWKRHCKCVEGLQGANYFIVGNFNPPGTDALEMVVIDSLFSNRIYLDFFEMRKPKRLFGIDTLMRNACLDLPMEIDSIPYVYLYNNDTISQFCSSQIGDYVIKQCPLGCISCFDLNVHVKESNCNFYVPNIISLSSANNNVFAPLFSANTDIEITSYSIWDRQGSLVYESKAETRAGWDGRVRGKYVNPGVYVYSIEYKCRDIKGISISRVSGDLTVIR